MGDAISKYDPRVVAFYERIWGKEEEQALLALVLDRLAQKFDKHAVLKGGMVLRVATLVTTWIVPFGKEKV